MGESMPGTGDGDKERDRGLLEAALFLAGKPLSRRKLAKILDEASLAYVDLLLDELREELSQTHRGIELRVKEGKILLQVKNDYVDAVAHLAPQQDIPRPILRSLAMIAYNNPMTQADLIKARGNKAYGHVQELIERRLIRAEAQGRTLLLHVTGEFLRHFGLTNVEEFRFNIQVPTAEEEELGEEQTTPLEELLAEENSPSAEESVGMNDSNAVTDSKEVE
jgi:segregation and condensation protein B